MKFTKININLNYLTYKFKKKKINPLKIKNPKKNFEIKNYYSFNDSFDIMPPTLESHIEEFRDRLILSLISLIVSCLISLSFAKELLLILQYPSITENIIFLQLSPGEFFFTSVEISAYFGFIASIPSIIFHFICYILPGLTRTEKEFLLPLIFYSVVLFLFGSAFSYKIIGPTALNFFTIYSKGSVETTISIKNYFDFYLRLMISCGIAFQIPTLQIILGKSKIFNSKLMLSQWKWVVIISTLIAAIITPSTDPITQLITALPLIVLYFFGALVTKYFEEE